MNFFIKRVLPLFLTVLMLTAFLPACKKKDGASGVSLADASYTVVYPDKNDTLKKAAQTLQTQIKSKYGVELTVTADTADPVEKEFLIGLTNRPLSEKAQRTARTNDMVAYAEGGSIAFVGGTDALVAKTITNFLSNVPDEAGFVTGEGELWRNDKKYGVTSLTINERPVTEYTLYYRANSAWLASDELVAYINEQLGALTSYQLIAKPYTDDKKTDFAAPAIVLTGEGKSHEMDEYSITQKDGVIKIGIGSASLGRSLLYKFFGERSAQKLSGDLTVTLPEKSWQAFDYPTFALTSGSNIRVMSYNVPGSIPDDPVNNDLAPRAPYVVETVLDYMPDFVCFQETAAGFPSQFGDLLIKGYAIACAKITESSAKTEEKWAEANASGNSQEKNDITKHDKQQIGKSCYTPIYYLKDRYELLEEHASLFYIGDRWMYTNTKTVGYAAFREKATGRIFVVMSTHFAIIGDGYTELVSQGYTNSVEGATMRYGNAGEILTIMNAMLEKYPDAFMIIAGDMNSTEDERSIKLLRNDPLLGEAYVMAGEKNRTEGSSFHGNTGNKPPASGKAIDHIFVSEAQCSVLLHKVLQDDYVVMGSDHCPVIADVKFK